MTWPYEDPNLVVSGFRDVKSFELWLVVTRAQKSQLSRDSQSEATPEGETPKKRFCYLLGWLAPKDPQWELLQYTLWDNELKKKR